MERSENINELAASLAKAQGAIHAAEKDRANPFFKSRYATLAACWEACREALSVNGLAVIQPVTRTEKMVTVTTILAHSSGQWISEVLTMTAWFQAQGEPLAPSERPQALGSAITYARRYALAAMVGVAPDDDDDGEGAEGRTGDEPRSDDGPRPMAAKYASKCPQCSNAIAVGAPVYWSKGSPAVHVECQSPPEEKKPTDPTISAEEKDRQANVVEALKEKSDPADVKAYWAEVAPGLKSDKAALAWTFKKCTERHFALTGSYMTSSKKDAGSGSTATA